MEQYLLKYLVCFLYELFSVHFNIYLNSRIKDIISINKESANEQREKEL